MAIQFTQSDSVNSYSITGVLPLAPDMSVMVEMFNIFATFNATTPLSSVSLTSITTKDGRTISRTLTSSGSLPASFSMTISSTQTWSGLEFQSIIRVLYLLDNLQLNYGVTAMTVTYN